MLEPVFGKKAFDLVSLGEGILSGPVLAPVVLPFLNADQLLSKKDDTKDIVAIDQLFAAYVFYHDTFDGERLASLFTPDGIFEDVYNDYGTLEPTFGVGGLGCVLRGRDQIAKFISDEVIGNSRFPSPFPGHSHHIVTSKLIKVDGDTATMAAAWLGVGTNDTTGAASVTITGEYLTDFKRTNDGWQISHNRPIVDRRGATGVCDLNGPIPR
jgi:ketosteroid isomerase-like protein